jgi:hypothetical protein
MNPVRRRRVGSFSVLAMAALLVPAGEAAAQDALIIYRDGRVLVRRELALAVPRGGSQHVIELDQFDAGSLVTLDAGVVLTSVRYPRDRDEASLYRGMLGRRMLFQLPGSQDTVSALLFGDDPLRFELANGQVRLSPPGIPLFPRALVGSARPTHIALDSDRPRSRVSFGYLTSGTTWRAEYSVLLGALTAEVSGRVVLSSTDLRADSAEITVLEGNVTQTSGFRREVPRMAEALRVDEMLVSGRAASFRPSFQGGPPLGIGGFRLYSVPGRHSLVPGQTTVGLLLPSQRVDAERVYTVSTPGLVPGRPEEQLPVEVRYRIARPRTSPLGSRALPPGLARLYARTPEGTTVLVGEATVEHADPGKALELVAGQAVEITARRMPVQMTLVADSVIGIDRRPQVSRSGQIADAEVRFSNVTDTLAVVELTEPIAQPAVLVSSSVPAERVDGALRFTVRVPPRAEVVLRYRVRLSR